MEVSIELFDRLFEQHDHREIIVGGAARQEPVHMPKDTTEDDSTEYLMFDHVAEKTWQVILTEGTSNIVVDLLSETDPGPAKTPEIRVYTEQPRPGIYPSDIREVIKYPAELSPSDAEPDAVYEQQGEEIVATIRLPHDGERLPVVDVTFTPPAASVRAAYVEVSELTTSEENDELVVGDTVFERWVNTEKLD